MSPASATLRRLGAIGGMLFALAAAHPTLAQDRPAPNQMAAKMTEDEIKRDVAAAFNHRFGALFYQNPIDKKFFPVPALEPGDLRVTGETDEAIELIHEPLVGMTVRARMLKPSGAIVFDKPEFAYE